MVPRERRHCFSLGTFLYLSLSLALFFLLFGGPLLAVGLVDAAAPPDGESDGVSHSHDALLGAGDGVDADLRVDVEHRGRAAALGERLDAHARQQVVVVLVGRNQVLLEHDLLAVVARERVAGAADTRLALGERGVALESGLDDGESGGCVSFAIFAEMRGEKVLF